MHDALSPLSFLLSSCFTRSWIVSSQIIFLKKTRGSGLWLVSGSLSFEKVRISTFIGYHKNLRISAMIGCSKFIVLSAVDQSSVAMLTTRCLSFPCILPSVASSRWLIWSFRRVISTWHSANNSIRCHELNCPRFWDCIGQWVVSHEIFLIGVNWSILNSAWWSMRSLVLTVTPVYVRIWPCYRPSCGHELHRLREISGHACKGKESMYATFIFFLNI